MRIIKILKDADLKPCPFCGCDKLTRSVNGGCLPAILSEKKRLRFIISMIIICLVRSGVTNAAY